ncbi:MAG: hypothetical protein HZA54_08645, partial [Planctomycetes bacterium]|nr:hypothetical protein [Planctomycetota bacterium]
DLAQILVDGAFRGILITLGDGLINGSSAAVPAQIDGFKSLVDPAQAIIAGGGPDGAALSIADLRHLLALVTSNDGRADFLVANRATFRKWLEIQYSAGIVVSVEHLCPEHLHACAECVDDGSACPGLIPVPMQDGVPFLVSDHVLSDEVQGATAGCTSVYAGVLDPAEGLCLTYPAQLGRAPIKVTHTINPLGDQELWRASLNVGLSMYSKGALARLKGVLN